MKIIRIKHVTEACEFTRALFAIGQRKRNEIPKLSDKVTIVIDAQYRMKE